MSENQKNNSGLFKLIGALVLVAVIIIGIFVFYKVDCKTDRKFGVWAQEKVGLYADKEGHFKQDTKFTGALEALEMEFDFVCAKDGKLSIVARYTSGGELTEEKTEGKYQIDKNIVTLTTVSDGKENKEYCYLYNGMLVYDLYIFGTSIPLLCTQEGVALSQKSDTKVVGYFFSINVDKGDLASTVINGKEQVKDKDGNVTDAGSKGQAYAVYANGKIAEVPKALNSDQITGYDATKGGSSIVEVKIGNKTYKAALHVYEMIF